MSIKLMSDIWDHGPASTSDRFVLLALADYANEAGECWPSIVSIRRRTCLSERGVQTVIRRLEADGWLTILTGNGRKGCNRYLIKNPAANASRSKCTPQMTAKTPQQTAQNPAAYAPEPLRTPTEPPFPPTPQGGREGKVSNFRKRAGPTHRQTMDAAIEILRKRDEEQERLGT